MIITVTMNPAMDRTITIPSFVHGGINRIKTVETDIGGKGVNVSKTIKMLGGLSKAIGFAGGNSGDELKNTLKQLGIQPDFIPVNSELRCNTKIVEDNGCVTELNEPGAEVGPMQLEALLRIVNAYAGSGNMFVLSGSVPKGVPVDIYARIIEKVHTKGGKVLLDADGELFRQALEAKPDIIKPNCMEMETLYGVQNAGLEELRSMGEKMLDKGIGKVVISMGSEGALFLEKEKALYGKGLNVKTNSTVGAGDAMAAVMAYAWERKFSMEQTAKLAIATSAGAATTKGTKTPTRELIDTLLDKVELVTL